MRSANDGGYYGSYGGGSTYGSGRVRRKAGILGGTGSAGRTRRRTLLVTTTYVLGLALVYATLGLIAGLTGTLFGTISSSPWAYFTFGNLLLLAALAMLGVQLVPDFLAKTPPFVESVRPASPAAKAGIRTDDLILFVNEQLVPSHKQVLEELTFIDRVDPVRLTIQRGQDLIEVQLTLEP